MMRYRNRIAVLVVLLSLFSACTDDVLSSRHATRADAADTIGRGWVPAVLPESATDIRETHNLDSNVGHGSFQFSAADMQSFQAALARVPGGRPVRAKSREKFEGSGYVFYTYEDFDIAVNWDDRKGQFWIGPK